MNLFLLWSESVSDGDDDGTQYDSRATSNMDMKTEDDENRSLTTGMTAEIETGLVEFCCCLEAL